jgi:hypothetical protein
MMQIPIAASLVFFAVVAQSADLVRRKRPMMAVGFAIDG